MTATIDWRLHQRSPKLPLQTYCNGAIAVDEAETSGVGETPKHLKKKKYKPRGVNKIGFRIPSAASPAGVNTRTPSKKRPKKPLEALDSSQPLPRKRKNNSFLGPRGTVKFQKHIEELCKKKKKDCFCRKLRSRKNWQKSVNLSSIAKLAKCGLKNISNDVERCLSLFVEERMRGLMSNLIRLSKQRVDIEKPRHRTLITSDVRQQIMAMNRKAREEWEKKKAEAERLRRLNEGNNGVDGDKEKDEGRGKSIKVNKEEDDKMRTTAANVAARAAVGGDDMLSKWQLMAEQARQKREGGGMDACCSQPSKDVSRRPLSTSGRKDNQDAEKKGNGASGGIRKAQAVLQTWVARSISIKDVIAVLERGPQMSRSSMIYRLYERIRSDGTTE
ncbi:Transcription initiation factor TFIID subunit 4b [Morella rubra]|uniref:Transcription initiation factor TFIID subunit 4b n=1 Tax=Morella rubra TaxID=262757 RepID=A0A6A1W045_9ROSI|nr:Transcription initiation factor TFIID subunit 4b [Morella rubra]